MDSPEGSLQPREPWRDLSRFTAARIALGRSGGSVRTPELLDFRLSHARARDAVQMTFEADRLVAMLEGAGIPCVTVATQVRSRAEFLARPDRGRRLDPGSLARLREQRVAWGVRDVVVIVSDGLSALAAGRQVVEVVPALLSHLSVAGLKVFPVVVAPFGRVKLQDEVGAVLGARVSLMLLGERPGLGSPDSLGAYFTYQPRERCTDADRNCLSNIRPEGLPPEAAAAKLAALMMESLRRGLSGVALKDDAPVVERIRSTVERADDLSAS